MVTVIIAANSKIARKTSLIPKRGLDQKKVEKGCFIHSCYTLYIGILYNSNAFPVMSSYCRARGIHLLVFMFTKPYFYHSRSLKHNKNAGNVTNQRIYHST